MIFLELVLQNFGPYLGRQVIDLKPQKENNHHPIILLGGMNGGGKTTLMDAIRLALYGNRAQCSTRGNLSYNDFLIQCVNSQTPGIEKTRVELACEHLMDGEMKEVRIVRTWTKNPKDGKDELGILIKDDIIHEEWPDKGLAETWDEYIENFLPLGISNLFLFDGEQVKELAELEAPPDPVIKAIESLLGLELAEKLSVDLDILAQRKRKAIAQTIQRAKLEEIETTLNQQKAEKQQAEDKLEILKEALKQAEANQKLANDRFVSEGGKIAAESSQLKNQLNQLLAEAEIQRQSLRTLAADSLPLSLISPLLNQAKTQGEIELKRQQAIAAQDILKEHDQRLVDYIMQLSLSQTKQQKIKFFLEEERQRLNQEIHAEILSFLETDSETLQNLNTLLTHQLPAQIQQSQDTLKKLEDLEYQIHSIEYKLAQAAPPEVYQQLEQAQKEADKNFINAKVAYEVGQQSINEIEQKIAKTRKYLEEYSEKSLAHQNTEHILNSIDKVQKTLKLFKEKLTLKKLNKLENEVTECFRYLLHKSDLVHRIIIETEDFSLSLYDPQGQPVPKHRLSAGEKQLLAIAFLWGLARVSGHNLPVAIDTPLGRLDSSHRQNLIERYFPAASHQVILLSTDTEIGENEVKNLREQDAIAREYLLKYDSSRRQTTIEPGYFW